MKLVQVKNLVLNEGLPKICVPVIGVTENEIIDEFNELMKIDIDLVELRADYYEFIQNQSMVINLLMKIREFYKKPILFTLRTKNEGGSSDITFEYYCKLNNTVIESKLVDLIDIEYFSISKEISDTICLARENKVKTIISNHDFNKTLSIEEIVIRLNKMLEYGDIAKIAVMPNSEEDILTLLSASLKFKKEKKGPFIAIAMGPLGIISRISCELFGSCITYAYYKNPSALGQIDVNLSKKLLRIMHS